MLECVPFNFQYSLSQAIMAFEICDASYLLVSSQFANLNDRTFKVSRGTNQVHKWFQTNSENVIHTKALR